MKDPQKRKVYDWEESQGWDKNATTFEVCKRRIEQACQWYDVTVPEVRSHRNELSWSLPWVDVISMREDGELNVPIALHEAAHHIVFKLRRERVQDHGPFFFGIYLDLLERFYRSNNVLRESARKAGIKWKEQSDDYG